MGKNSDTPEDSSKELFVNIGDPHDMTDEESFVVDIQNAVAVKTKNFNTELLEQEEAIEAETSLMVQRTNAIQTNHQVFDLKNVLEGWFDKNELENAVGQVINRKGLNLDVDTISKYGAIPDSVVRQFVNSAATKASGEARLEVAEVLDRATGVTREISNDDGISSELITEKAQKLLKVWKSVKARNRMFTRLFNKTLNRVVKYQTRLREQGQDLATKQVTLENISSSLIARRVLVRSSLYDTCISGITLESILEREQEQLRNLIIQKDSNTDISPQVYTEKIQEQEALIQISTKRLVDLKAFAIKLIGLYSVLGNTKLGMAVINSDVEFTRTNLMATLGMQLGMVVDIIAAIRISKATQDLRIAEAEASEKVGVATAALDEAAKEILTNIDTTLRSVGATVQAALVSIANSHDNMQRVQDMQVRADQKFGKLFSDMAA